MEEKVEIEAPSGKMEITLGGPLTILQRRTVNSILGGGRVHPLDKEGNAQVQVKIEDTYDFQLKLVEFSIRSPDSAKTPAFIGGLSDVEFAKLFAAANRVTGNDQKKADAAEKKSESPSSAG